MTVAVTPEALNRFATMPVDSGVVAPRIKPATLAVVIALHAALLFALAHYRTEVTPPKPPVMVTLITPEPAPEPPKPEITPPKPLPAAPKPVKKRVEPKPEKKPEPVPVVGRDQHVAGVRYDGAEPAAQPRDVGVQRPVRTARRLPAPDQVDDRARRDVLVAVQRERGQHRTRLACSQLLLGPVVAEQARRAEDVEEHAATVGRGTAGGDGITG